MNYEQDLRTASIYSGFVGGNPPVVAPYLCQWALGPDHVDATRTVALAASPYVKRGGVVSDRYDQLSLLRTVELVLGLDPINLNDALAVPMFGIFTDQPNNSVYVAPTPSNYLIKTDKDLYQKVK